MKSAIMSNKSIKILMRVTVKVHNYFRLLKKEEEHRNLTENKSHYLKEK